MNESEPLVDVSLILHGESLDPAQVTLMLGTEGSKMRRKGERWHTSTGHEVITKIGLWALDAKRESMSVHEQISWLRQELNSARCPPFQIPGVQEVEISVFIALGPNDRGGGDYEFQLFPEDLVWINSLGATVSFALTYIQE